MKITSVIIIALLSIGSQAQAVNVDVNDVYLILKGVIEGIQAESVLDLNDVVACIQDTEGIFLKLEKAVQLLVTQESGNVKTAIKLIGEAIQALPDAITDCQSGSQELQNFAKVLTNLLEQLRHPLKFSFKIAKNLFVNGFDILNEVNTAVTDWKQHNYEDFGVQVGHILVQLLSGMQNVEAVINDKPVTVIVFDGVLLGIVDASGVKAADFEKCYTNSREIVIDFEGAVRLLQKQNAADIIEALQLFADALDHLPEAINGCGAATKEILDLAKKLTSLIASLRSPQSFAFHIGKDLIVNGKDIYNETFTAVDDWKSGNFQDFGFQLGKILFQVFVGLEQKQQ